MSVENYFKGHYFRVATDPSWKYRFLWQSVSRGKPGSGSIQTYKRRRDATCSLIRHLDRWIGGEVLKVPKTQSDIPILISSSPGDMSFMDEFLKRKNNMVLFYHNPVFEYHEKFVLLDERVKNLEEERYGN